MAVFNSCVQQADMEDFKIADESGNYTAILGKSSTHFLGRTPGKASKLRRGIDQPQSVIVNSWRNGIF